MVRVRSGNTVPFWTSQGFIEILKGGETVDFVRFGASTQAPTTSGHWSGSSVSSLASSATNYGRAIVRAHPISLDSNTASDWKSVAWATPAGRNDVGSSATDADGDGIPDSAEVSGGTFAGLDLYAMGARTGKRDIFIEVDYMDIADPGVIPRAEALQKVVDAFAAKNIAVHFDAGTLFNPSFSTANFNLGQDSNEVPYEPCVAFNQTTCIQNVSSRRSIYDYKAEYMDLRRRGVFHYLLFANSLAANGAQSSSGLAELEGNDLIVSLGNWGLDDTAGPNLNILINAQAGTVMHELGHNLGLRHGGNEDANYKPNYWSVMNYLYQLYGLEADPTADTAYERWRLVIGDGTVRGVPDDICSLVNSPCDDPSEHIIDYSNGSSSQLNEDNLLESNNIGRGSSGGAYADWDLSGSLASSPYALDLNADALEDEPAPITLLNDYNDWANLKFPFARSFWGNSGASWLPKPTQSMVSNPITADKQPIAHETPLPARILKQLRREK